MKFCSKRTPCLKISTFGTSILLLTTMLLLNVIGSIYYDQYLKPYDGWSIHNQCQIVDKKIVGNNEGDYIGKIIIRPEPDNMATAVIETDTSRNKCMINVTLEDYPTDGIIPCAQNPDDHRWIFIHPKFLQERDERHEWTWDLIYSVICFAGLTCCFGSGWGLSKCWDNHFGKNQMTSKSRHIQQSKRPVNARAQRSHSRSQSQSHGLYPSISHHGSRTSRKSRGYSRGSQFYV